MPSFVVIIALLSFLSFVYSMKVLNQETLRLHMVTEPFGSGVGGTMEQLLRLCVASIFAAASLFCVLMSCALIWLSLQPSMVG